MSILRHSDIDTEARDAYIRIANAHRRAESGNGDGDGEHEAPSSEDLIPDRFAEFEAAEQFILSVTENGYGKRTSAYEYRITNRGGQGIANIETSDRNGLVVASFPVDRHDQIMLVTDAGQVIRCPVDDIRIAGRRTQGVRLFKTADDERVVSVARLDEDANGEEDEAEEAS